MTKKETEDLAIDILNHLSIASEPGSYAEDVANSATELCRTILERYPHIRYEIWQWSQEFVLDNLGLDYGYPKI